MAAPSLKPSQVASDVLTEAVRDRVAGAVNRSAAATASPDAAPTNNPFYKVMFDESMDPEAKKQAVAKLVTFTGSKEESRERIKEYAAFEEYMQSVRERMATAMIKLQDTDTFAILQTVMNNLNGQLVDFEKQMQPLTDITDAIYTLRTNDATMDVFKEIQNDKDREAKEKALNDERSLRFDALHDKISDLQSQSARLSEEKSFFGLGPVTKDARQKMAENALELQRSKADLDALQNELESLDKKDEAAPSQFAKEKAKLRELLDLTSDTHKERQKALVQSALSFVESAKRDIGEVKTHLEKMNGQVENLLDNNTRMTGVYAIMSEGIEDAQKDNHKIRESVVIAPPDERSIAKLQREDKKMVLDDHIRLLDNAIRTTTAASADLTSQTIRVKGMKDANEATLETTRVLHTQGVAGIADRLSSTLQAVSSAALGESSAAAKDTLRKMAESTDKVSQRESIRVAMGVKDMNSDLIAALDSLSAYGEVQRAANDITRAGLSDIRVNLDKIREAAASTQKDLHDSFAAAADAVAPPAAPAPDKTTESSPFKI
jgi:hypothetical protein